MDARICIHINNIIERLLEWFSRRAGGRGEECPSPLWWHRSKKKPDGVFVGEKGGADGLQMRVPDIQKMIGNSEKAAPYLHRNYRAASLP